MFSVCSPVVKTPTRIPRGSCQRHRRTERERASKQPCERAMKGAGCFMKPRLPASRDSAPPGGLPGGRGLPALFQGSPSVGELREGHQEFWVLPFQLQQWKRTFYPAVTPGRPSHRRPEHSRLLLPVLQTGLKCHVPPESLACSAQVRGNKHLQHALHMVLHSGASCPDRKCCDTCPSPRRDRACQRAVIPPLRQGLATWAPGKDHWDEHTRTAERCRSRLCGNVEEVLSLSSRSGG